MPVIVKLNVLEDILPRLVLYAFPVTSPRFKVLKKDSASALSHGLPDLDIDWVFNVSF